MKFSISWLNDYTPIERDPADLADALTMAGLEVESVTDRYAYLNSVFVGRIEEINPHPNADKLKLCQVVSGDRRLAVVCGFAGAIFLVASDTFCRFLGSAANLGRFPVGIVTALIGGPFFIWLLRNRYRAGEP